MYRNVLSNNFIGIQFFNRNMNRSLLFRGIQTLPNELIHFQVKTRKASSAGRLVRRFRTLELLLEHPRGPL